MRVVLESERMLFRSHEPSDKEAYCAMEMDAEVRRYVGGYARSREDAEGRFLRALVPNTDRLGMWATVLKESGCYVGRCGLYPKLEGDGVVPGEAVLAFYMAREYWGRGLASEAGRALVRFGFEELKLERIVATIDVRNEVSARVLERLQFERVGTEVGERSFAHYELVRGDRSWEDGLGWMGRVLLVGMICLALAGCAPPRGSRITVGAKNFTEQVIAGELLAQEIEAVGHERVERRFYLAGSYICQQALVGGRIDAYVEYTGTALTAILKQPVDRDAGRVLATVRDLYAKRYQIRVEAPLGFEDTFAMVVRGETARKDGVRTLSEAVPYAPGWRLGVGYEFQERPDGLGGLEAAYGLRFAGSPRVMDLGLLYRSLTAGQVDIVSGNSTDGPIRALGFEILADDRHYFPPYEAVPLVREETIREHPEVQVAMDRLAGKVSAEEMQAMNEAVDAEHRDAGDVVREFRSRKGL